MFTNHMLICLWKWGYLKGYEGTKMVVEGSDASEGAEGFEDFDGFWVICLYLNQRKIASFSWSALWKT